MGKKRLPDLRDTGRRYLEHTTRARLQGPGIERYSPPRGRGRGIAVGLAVLAALLAALVAAVLLLR